MTDARTQIAEKIRTQKLPSSGRMFFMSELEAGYAADRVLAAIASGEIVLPAARLRQETAASAAAGTEGQS